MTPIGGLGWLDKNVARRVEAASLNRFLINLVVVSIRLGAEPTYCTAKLPGVVPATQANVFNSVDEAVDSSLVDPAADPVIATGHASAQHRWKCGLRVCLDERQCRVLLPYQHERMERICRNESASLFSGDR